jgi:hypothetical protein
MENFEALQNIDNFCKIIVKKTVPDLDRRLGESSVDSIMQPDLEEPLIDVFDEEDHIKILVQCRCREQQVTFHPVKDGITICRQECNTNKVGVETCTDFCRKLSLRTDELQLENMLFIIAKCNNNNTLEAMIPKIKQLTP